MKYRLPITALLCAFGAVWQVPVQADPPQPLGCRNGFFPSKQDALFLAKVDGKQPRLYFYDDSEGCPQNGESCKDKTYVLPGDELLINTVADGWACAWYPGSHHETVGWVEANRLEREPSNGAEDLSEWTGTWSFYGDKISITAKGKELEVQGDAIWQGARLPGGGRATNVGDIEGPMVPANGRAHLSEGEGHEDDCAADFALIGKFLVVADNHNCGGMNVDFDGIYRRR